MLDKETLTVLCGIIACIIGICTFVIGMKNRATNDGALIQKINQALDGINELKNDFKNQSSVEKNLELRVQTHDEQIKTLFKNLEALDVTNKVLTTIADSIVQMNRRNTD